MDAWKILRPFVVMDFSVNSTYWDSFNTRENKILSVVGTLIFDMDIANIEDATKQHLHEGAHTAMIANLSSDVVAKNCH